MALLAVFRHECSFTDPRSCGGCSSRVATSRQHAANVGLVHRRGAGEPPLGGQLAVTPLRPSSSSIPPTRPRRVFCGRERRSRGRQRITRAGRASGWVGWERLASASSRLPTSSESATSGAAPAAPRPNLTCRPPPPPPPSPPAYSPVRLYLYSSYPPRPLPGSGQCGLTSGKA